MKRTTKSMLVTALILFSTGLILTIGSYIFAFASGVDIYGNANRSYDFQSFAMNLTALRAEAGASEQALSELEIISQVGNIQVQATDGETHFEFMNVDRNNLVFSYSTGVLSISEKEASNYFGLNVSKEGFSFQGIRYLFSPNNFNGAEKIILFWNQSESIKSLRLTAIAGTVTAENLKISSNLTMNVSVGSIRVSNCVSNSGTLSAKVSLGKIKAQNNEFLLSNLYATFGGINAKINGQKTTAETVLGSISIELLKPTEDYNLRCVTTIGGVTLPNSSRVGSEYTSSLTNGENALTATSIVGSIRLKSNLS